MKKPVYHESAKTKKKFVLSNFCGFVINPLWFRLVRAGLFNVSTFQLLDQLIEFSG